MNIGKNTIANYEKYRTKPNIDTAKKMAELYGVSIDDIFYRTIVLKAQLIVTEVKKCLNS